MKTNPCYKFETHTCTVTQSLHFVSEYLLHYMGFYQGKKESIFLIFDGEYILNATKNPKETQLFATFYALCLS